jgi:aminomethyltransferase
VSSLRWLQDSDWSYLEVSGADRVDFFHRLTTNRVPKAGEPLLHSFFLSVNAKVLAELWIGAGAETLSLFVPSAQLGSARENIDRYHFGERLELHEPAGCPYVVIDASAEEMEQLSALASFTARPDPRHGERAAWLFVEQAKQAGIRARLEGLGSEMSPGQAELLRVQTGRPRFGVDYTEETLFLELAQQGDFSESKGCYPGQEIVARVLHRGRLNRHLRAFESSQSVPGDWSLVSDGKEMARVTTSVATPEGGSRGLLYVRREVGDDGAELTGADAQGRTYTLTVRPRAMEVMTGEPA